MHPSKSNLKTDDNSTQEEPEMRLVKIINSAYKSTDKVSVNFKLRNFAL